MADNQQIQNFITALEQATGVSVDADLTAESVTIEDSNGNQLAIDTNGNITVAEVVSTLTVTDDGTFSIDSLPEPLDVSDATVTVTDDGTLAVSSLPEPLDVSSATVTVTDDGSLTISDSTGNVIEEPLDVSDATVTVTDDGALAVSSLPEPLDVSGATVSVQENTALDVSGATVTVTDDGALDVNTVSGQVDVVDQPGSTGSYGSASVGTTAQEVLAAGTGRRSLMIQNNGSAAVYVGFDSSVTASSGVKVPAGGTYADETYSGALYVISESGTNDIRFQEVTA